MVVHPHLGRVIIMYWNNAFSKWGYSKPNRIGDLKIDEGHLALLQLIVGTEEEYSTLSCRFGIWGGGASR